MSAILAKIAQALECKKSLGRAGTGRSDLPIRPERRLAKPPWKLCPGANPRQEPWFVGCRPTLAEIPAQREAGSGLVEILVAVAIVSLSVAILIAALSTAALAVRTSNRLTTATNLAAAQLESVKADTYADVAAGLHTAVPVPPGYMVAVSRSEVLTGMLQVTVTVSYQGDALVAVSNYKVDR